MAPSVLHMVERVRVSLAPLLEATDSVYEDSTFRN